MHKATRHNGRHSEYNLNNDFKHLKEALSETGEDIKGKAAEILAKSFHDVQSRSLDARDSIADYVSDKPFKSLGFALLGGLILGILLRRK